LAISNDTSNLIDQKIKAKFADYKVSFISKTGFVDFELLIKTGPSQSDENNILKQYDRPVVQVKFPMARHVIF
jgi:predicted ThiF/HesA family dinucleotide-utilizing enzyme